MSGPVTRFSGRDLQLELQDPASLSLVRLFHHPGGQWDPTPEIHRGLRVDPPAGHKADYAVLYMARSIRAVAMECRVLVVDRDQDLYGWKTNLATKYRVARYACSKPAIFLPIDKNAMKLGLDEDSREFCGYLDYQAVAHDIFKRYGNVIHGLSWVSFHRNQPGRVYALWHHHKDTVGLKPTLPEAECPRLIDDEEWKAFLERYPQIEAIAPPDPEPEVDSSGPQPD